MAVINTGLLLPGLRSEFFNAYRNVPQRYLDVCTRVASDKDQEVYRWLGSTAMVREWVGPRQAVQIYPETYTIVNKLWEWTMEVDRREAQNAQTSQIAQKARDGGAKQGLHKDKLIAALLAAGATTGSVTYDAKGETTPTFFSASHLVRKTGASMTNLSTSAAATATQPTTAEMREAISGAIAVMRALLDDQGDPIDIGMDGFQIIVPPVYEQVTREALQATIIASTTNVMAGIGNLMVNSFLTAADKWYLAYTAGPIRPFIFQDRSPIEFYAKEADSEGAFETDKFRYGTRAEYQIAYGEWRYCVQHTFT